jgi:hypothetical protein
MLSILHGNDTALSRKTFLEEKQKYPDAIFLDADQVNLTDLTQIFEGGGLFGETKYVFIEQYLTKKKKSSDYKTILAYFEKNASENTVVFWENKELERNSLNELKNAAVKVFKLPQTLFQLLDAIQPRNYKLLVKLFHQTIETTETEMVFFMLVRQFRILLAFSKQTSLRDQEAAKQSRDEIAARSSIALNDENPIDELKRFAPWQRSKLEKQAKSFELFHLLELYNKLFKIEVGQKTGGLTTSLVCAIDFFLLEV